MMTPNMQVVHDYVLRDYGRDVGVYTCRRISGSQTYSQHSWSNANDIYTEDKGLQDQIAADIKYQFGDNIRNVLTWRYNAAHWNHLHVDMWPKGYLTPPCKGALLRVKHKNGNIGSVFTSDIGEDELSILTDNEQRQLQDFLSELDGINSNVSFVRYVIPWFRNWRSSLPQHFLPVDADLSAVDNQARKGVSVIHDRLDKLKDI